MRSSRLVIEEEEALFDRLPKTGGKTARWTKAAQWAVELEQQQVKNDRGKRKVAVLGVAYDEI